MAKSSVYFTLDDVNDKHDVKAIKRELDTLPGILSVSVSDSSNCVAIDFDSTGIQSERIEKRLEKMGYLILDAKMDNPIM